MNLDSGGGGDDEDRLADTFFLCRLLGGEICESGGDGFIVYC